MKSARWVCIYFLTLLLLLGTTYCAGPRAQTAKETPREAAPEEPVKKADALASEAPQGSPEAPKMIPQEPPRPQTVRPPGGPSVPPSPASPPTDVPPNVVPPVVATPPGAPAPAGRSGRFVLNFDNADIYEVIRVMSEMMSMNYIVDPRVKGVVNIRTTGQISTQDIFPIFQAILNLNGAAAVKKGIIYEIVPFGDAKKLYTPPSMDRERESGQSEERYTIQIIVLKYIPAAEASKMIKPFLTDGADIVEYPNHNILIVGDVASNIRKTMEILDLFDVDIFADMRVRIYPVLNSYADDVAKEMERIFSSLEVSVKSGRGVGITFTPVIRINSLLVVSSIPGIFDKVEKWLKELDRVPGEGNRLNTFVYYVQNGKAKDLADVLKQVYTPARVAAARTGTTTTTTPASQQRLTRPTTTTTPGTTTAPAGIPAIPTPGAEAMGIPEGEINIVVDEVTNSLIIRAYQRDYRTIMETIKKLDIYPKQVLIEVLLAEVTLNESTKFGLEFSTFTDSFTKGSSTYNYTIGAGGTGTPANFTSGLRYAITSAGKLAAAVNASASQDRLRVISSPHVMASNNKEARIQIGSSQPILTNTYTTTATGTPGVVEGTIEYKDVGIILTVTPRISDAKLVTLDMSVESSTVGTTQLGNLSSVPFFGKKTAKTTLSIIEGQTIVIGGLIQESKDTIKTGIPFLSRIPILGALFGYHDYEKNKTETVIFLTPHVIGELDDSNRITEEFREKLWGIQKELEAQKKETEKDKKKSLPLY